MTMKELHCEVAIIGAGTAGMSAYRAARQHTDKVLLIEGAHYGTTCARVGCMPSKLLIAAADAAHGIGEAHRFGVIAAPPRIDGPAVMARVRSERDRFVGFVTAAVDEWPAEHKLWGRARFIAEGVLQVAEHSHIHADRIIIATGSHPVVPSGWREALGERLIVNDELFDWQDLPESVAVIGTGVIGLELAQALHRLGVRVRLAGRGRKVGPLSDPALQALSTELMAAELPLSLDVQGLQLSREGECVRLQAHTAGGALDERFDYLLAAIGRAPNLHGLGLENAGLALGPDGLPIGLDRHTGQIGGSRVFMAGDVSDERPLLHEAADAGRIAGDNAGRWPDVRVRPRRAPLAVVFSDPQMMTAGASHAELRATPGLRFETGEVCFADQGRSRVMGVNRGALHVYGDCDSGRFLGAEMIGPAAEHLGHLLAWSAQRGDTVQQMLDCPFYHPVIEEGLRTALRQLQRKLHMGPVPVEHCLDCGPGG